MCESEGSGGTATYAARTCEKYQILMNKILCTLKNVTYDRLIIQSVLYKAKLDNIKAQKCFTCISHCFKKQSALVLVPTVKPV